MFLLSCLPFLHKRKQPNAVSWPPSRSHASSVSPQEFTTPPSARSIPISEGPPPAYTLGNYVRRPTFPARPPFKERERSTHCSSHLQSGATDFEPSGLSADDGKSADRCTGKKDQAPSWEIEVRTKVAEIRDLGTRFEESTTAIRTGEYTSDLGCKGPYTQRNALESSFYAAQKDLLSIFRDAQVDDCTWTRMEAILNEQSADDTVRKTFESVWKYALPKTSRSRALIAAARPSTASVPPETERLALTPPGSTVTIHGVSASGHDFAVSFEWENPTGFR